MPSKNSLIRVFLLFLTLFVIACTKAKPDMNSVSGAGTGSGNGSGTGSNPPPGTGNNPPPAGQIKVLTYPDVTISSPLNAAMLHGLFEYAGGSPGDSVRMLWTQVSGPASALIEKPDSTYTKVSNLAAGTYRFRFTVSTVTRPASSDTLTVTVLPPSPDREILFSRLPIFSDFWAWLDCGYITPYFDPSVTMIRVYIRGEGSPSWEQVASLPPNYFTFSINQGYFSVIDYWSNGFPARPEVKIIF